jgi:hypothetical protein
MTISCINFCLTYNDVAIILAAEILDCLSIYAAKRNVNIDMKLLSTTTNLSCATARPIVLSLIKLCISVAPWTAAVLPRRTAASQSGVLSPVN